MSERTTERTSTRARVLAAIGKGREAAITSRQLALTARCSPREARSQSIADMQPGNGLSIRLAT